MKLQKFIFPPQTATSQQIRSNRQLRLGEFLIAEKILTREQVNSAVEAQQLYGSRLGTSLIELGYIDEDSFAKVLSSKLNLPYIDPSALMEIPPEILALVPPELAQKHSAVPCGCVGKKLYLAMVDPLNLAAIDDLSFRLGYIITPVIAPELRLRFALSKFYQLKLSPRLKTLSQHLLNKKNRCTDQAASPWLETDDLPPSQLTLETGNAVKQPAYAPRQAVTPPRIAVALVPKPERPAATPRVSPPSPVPPAQPQPPVAPDINRQVPFSQFCTLLADAKEREAIGKILLGYLGQVFPCGAVLTVKGNFASGWHATLNGQPLFNFDQLTIALDQPSLVQRVVEDKHYYLGPPATAAQDIQLLKCFTSKVPEAVLLVPLIIQNRLIGVLYIQDNRERLEEKLAEVHQIAVKTSMAFEILILRGKILVC